MGMVEQNTKGVDIDESYGVRVRERHEVFYGALFVIAGQLKVAE